MSTAASVTFRAAARGIDVVLRSGVFVALCAVALAWETSLLARARTRPIAFYAFLFFATWSSYRLHTLVARKQSGSPITKPTAASAAIAFAGAALCLPAVPMAHWPVIAVAAMLALAYTLPALPGGRALREFGLMKIAVLAGVWTLITAYLPAAGADPAHVAYLCARRFAFMFALCVAFDVRDAEADQRSGIRTIAVRLGPRRSWALVRATLVAFAALVLIEPLVSHPLGQTSIALLASAGLTWLAIEAARRSSTQRVYLGCVDGMMLVQCLLIVAVRHIRL